MSNIVAESPTPIVVTVADADLPAGHDWAVATTREGDTYAFVKASAPESARREAETVAARKAAERVTA